MKHALKHGDQVKYINAGLGAIIHLVGLRGTVMSINSVNNAVLVVWENGEKRDHDVRYLELMSSEPKGIDWSKPVQTTEGQAIRILCTDGPVKYYPVVGIVGKDVRLWSLVGDCYNAQNRDKAMNCPPPKAKKKLMVVLRKRTGGIADGHVKAGVVEHYGVHDTPTWTIVARKEITIEEGEGF